MYTEDHQMYVLGKKHDVVTQSINTQGEQALSWYKNNSSLSQPRKVSATLTYNNTRNADTDSDNQNVSVDGHAIERMEEIKLLGVQIEKKKFCQSKSRSPSAATQLGSL